MDTISNKLNYLIDTKEQIRIKLNNKGVSIDKTTPFREYTNAIENLNTGNTEPPIIDFDTVVQTQIDDWLFSKSDSDYTKITLPHSCNVADCRASNTYRGLGYYKYIYSLTQDDLLYNHYLKLEQTTMCSTIYLNGAQIYYHSSGYTPCTIKLDGLTAGDNEIKVVCNNSINYDIIPISADFTFPNGIIGLAYIIKTKGISLDPIEYGIDKAHISQLDISSEKAIFDVECAIINSDVINPVNITVQTIVSDATNTSVLSNEDLFLISAGETYLYKKNLNLLNPHLWQGREDPYLYTISVNIIYNTVIVDKIDIPIGFRKIEADHDNGITLNNKPIRLWGAAIHQDNQEHFAAMTHKDYEDNYEIYNDVGMNYLRLAHYPHNVYDYILADKYGYLTEVEQPWINNCPLNCSEAFKQSIFQYTKDMINNLYNHTCIAMWGMSNELGGNHSPINGNVLGGYSKTLAVQLNNKAYMLARKYDVTRPIGFQTTASSMCLDFLGDWQAFNSYDLWYTQSSTQQTSTYNSLHKQFRYIDGISEYGAGANVEQQSENWLSEENIGSSGTNHFESYQSYVHEIQMNKIIPLNTMKYMCFMGIL